MKKIFALFISAALALTAVGCGGNTTDTSSASSSAEATTQENTETTKTDSTEATDAADTETATSQDASSTEPLNIAYLVSANLGDMSFYDSAYSGLQLAEEKLGATVDVTECGNDVAKFKDALLDAAESNKNYDLIILGSPFLEQLETYADDYPDKEFIIFDTDIDRSKSATQFNNVYCITYKSNEASFLAGYLATKLTSSGAEGFNDQNMISFLGGRDNPVVNDFLVGYVDGALNASPDVKVAYSYANSYTDSAKGKELALSMFNQGSDVCFAVAGGTGTGAIEAAIEKNAYIIGVDMDQALLYKETKPEYSSVIFTSVLKNVGPSVYDAVEAKQNGTLEMGTTVKLGIAEGGVGLADNEFFTAIVPEELRTEVKELEAKVTSGDIKIASAYDEGLDVTTFLEKVKP